MKNALIQFMKNIPSDVDAVIVTSEENRFYFTGMKSSAGTLVVTKKSAWFLIDFRYIEKAKSLITDYEVIMSNNDIYAQISTILAEQSVTTVAIEAASLTVTAFNKYQQKIPNVVFTQSDAVSLIIEKQRAVKSDKELECIRQAQAITDKAFLHMLNYLKVGLSEREVALELEYTLKKLGASGIAFESIVVSGINTSLPHGVPTDKRIVQGDFLTMDFGASYNEYCSDMTRTVAFGAVTGEQQHVYDTVLKANLMAIDAIKPGKKCSDIDKVARDYIYAQGFEGCFGHGLGHSLGINIHEEPRFSMLCDELVTPNTVLTVEPGVYLNNKFGVRIEDMVIITENGCEIVTKSEKNLITL